MNNMNNHRRELIVDVLASACILGFTSIGSENQKAAVRSAAAEYLDVVWRVQWKEIKKLKKREHRHALIEDFWSYIHTELEARRKVYKFQAIWDESVNPPGKMGQVDLSIQPTNTATRWSLRLRP